MAHYAYIDENNIVCMVIVGKDETEMIDGLDAETYYGKSTSYIVKRTSYNGNIRKQFAGIGFTYDSANDVFISPQPYPSWSLNKNFDWQAPVDRPEGLFWTWDEDTLSWIKLDA